MLDPWQLAMQWGAGTVLAVLTATYGPAYRNPGAAMAIAPDGRFAGAITSGCVEADLILRAADVRRTGQTQNLRYGQGSPFFDLRLPCGGSVEIRLFLLRDLLILADLDRCRTLRRPISLKVSTDGRLSLGNWHPTGCDGTDFRVGFRPSLRFLVFGTGAEAATFIGLVRAMDYDHVLLSHDEQTLAYVHAAGSATMLIDTRFKPEELKIDTSDAVVLFYHDHDYETGILQNVVRTPAFYIGAQGSRATQVARLTRLLEMGLSDDELARIHGPIGLIRSSRDPNSLAISVLAEIIGRYGEQAEPMTR